MTFTIRMAQTGVCFQAHPDEPVLHAGLRNHINLPHSCKVGGCGRCLVKMLDGEVTYEEMPYVLSRRESEEGYILTCKARACTDLTLTTQAPGQSI